jgi:hypothetical protein
MYNLGMEYQRPCQQFVASGLVVFLTAGIALEVTSEDKNRWAVQPHRDTETHQHEYLNLSSDIYASGNVANAAAQTVSFKCGPNASVERAKGGTPAQSPWRDVTARRRRGDSRSSAVQAFGAFRLAFQPAQKQMTARNFPGVRFHIRKS